MPRRLPAGLTLLALLAALAAVAGGRSTTFLRGSVADYPIDFPRDSIAIEERVLALVTANGGKNPQGIRRTILGMVRAVVRRSVDPAFNIDGDIALDANGNPLTATIDTSTQTIVRETPDVLQGLNTRYFRIANYPLIDRADLLQMLPVLRTYLTCGNGRIDSTFVDGGFNAGETCDDGNTANGDGCSDRCLVERGGECDASVEPSGCRLLCGNGTVENIDARPPAPGDPGEMAHAEQCDDGNRVDDDLCSNECSPRTWWVTALNVPGPEPVDWATTSFTYDRSEGPFRLVRRDGEPPVLLWFRYKDGQPDSTAETFVSTKAPDGWHTEPVEYLSVTAADGGFAADTHTRPLRAAALAIDARGTMTVFSRSPVADCGNGACFRLIQKPAGSAVWSRATVVASDALSGMDYDVPAFADAVFDGENNGLIVWAHCVQATSVSQRCSAAAMTAIDGRWNTPRLLSMAMDFPAEEPAPQPEISHAAGDGTFEVRWLARTLAVNVRESAPLAPTCGNGAADPGEECDGDAFGLVGGYADSCVLRGFRDGPLSCRIDCTADASQCTNDVLTTPPAFDVLAAEASAGGPRVVLVVRGFRPEDGQHVALKSGEWVITLPNAGELTEVPPMINARGVGNVPLDPAAPKTGTLQAIVVDANGAVVAERTTDYAVE